LSHGGKTKLNCEISQSYLKSDSSVYVTNLEKSNLKANPFSNVYQSQHDFNVSTTESEAVEISIDIIRNSVMELTSNVLASPTEVRNTIRSLRLAKTAGLD
jgi:hypothetical protein